MIATTEDRRQTLAVAAAATVACVLVSLPFLLAGPGFYLDDWRNLARLDTVGWLRSAEASRFASRPGAWGVEMVLYPTLRDHAGAWVVVLALLNAATATVLYLLLRRFTPHRWAVAVVLLWILLPNHSSLRLFPNTAPMVVGLGLLALGLLVADEGHLVWGAVAISLGGMCLEVMLVPGLVGVVLIHRLRAVGTRRDAGWASAIIVATGLLMSIHPTYRPGEARRGTPGPALRGLFTSGLTPNAAIATLLGVIAVVGTVAAAVAWWRGERGVGEGPWLVATGLAVVVLGLVPYALKWPVGDRGQADRNFVVSSVGVALLWIGWGRVLLGRRRLALGAGALALAAVLVAANVRFQRDWAESADLSRDLLRGVECRYPDGPPEGFAVGPWVPVPGQVRPLHQFYLEDASRVVLGHPLRFTLAEGEDEWRDRPPELRATWDELVAEGRRGC
ncbi:MAG: hypothetical protein KF703_16105 [Actinobacteria bacterium]|nr:hypothetical protein [Actinomycetota bacterium]